MVSSLEVPVRATRAELSLPATGSAKLTKVAFPLVYTGSAPSKVLAFVAATAGDSVQVELSYPDRPAGAWKDTCRLTGAKIKLPGKKDGERVAVVLALTLTRADTRAPRELLEFLLDAAHAEALELDMKVRVVQEPLPFQEPPDPRVDERVRRAGGSLAVPEPARRAARGPKASSPPPA